MMTITYILAAVVLLGLCIFVHELGHLLGGRLVGIKAKVFSLGYGKGFIQKKIGETTYQITLIPLGGYCQFYGEDPGEESQGKEYEFLSARPWRRIVTVAMGPLFNLLFGIAIFFVMNLAGYEIETNRILIPRELRQAPAVSPAYEAGLRDGDIITAIGGDTIRGFSDIQSSVIFSEGRPLEVTVDRGGEKKVFTVTPAGHENSGRYSIGVTPFGQRVVFAVVMEGDVAHEAGLRPMDRLLKVDGTPVASPEDFIGYVKTRAGRNLSLEIGRGEENLTIGITPRLNQVVSIDGVQVVDARMAETAVSRGTLRVNGTLAESAEAFFSKVRSLSGSTGSVEIEGTLTSGAFGYEEKGYIGVYPVTAPDMIKLQYGPLEGFGQALVEPYRFVVMNLKGMGMLFTGRMNVRENLSGPIRIAKIAGDVAYYKGISAFVILMAKISIILMVMNFLPIPVVDGGHLVFFIVEAIRGKPLNQQLMERIQTVGVVLLIMLGVFVIVNDLSMLPAIQKFFR